MTQITTPDFSAWCAAAQQVISHPACGLLRYARHADVVSMLTQAADMLTAPGAIRGMILTGDDGGPRLKKSSQINRLEMEADRLRREQDNATSAAALVAKAAGWQEASREYKSWLRLAQDRECARSTYEGLSATGWLAIWDASGHSPLDWSPPQMWDEKAGHFFQCAYDAWDRSQGFAGAVPRAEDWPLTALAASLGVDSPRTRWPVTSISRRIREIAENIGRAIARDVLADRLPRGWTGLDPQDADRLRQVGLEHGTREWEAAEIAAEVAYAEAINR